MRPLEAVVFVCFAEKGAAARARLRLQRPFSGCAIVKSLRRSWRGASLWRCRQYVATVDEREHSCAKRDSRIQTEGVPRGSSSKDWPAKRGACASSRCESEVSLLLLIVAPLLLLFAIADCRALSASSETHERTI